MRIPLYTAQSRATSEAPGKSITARKNVQLAAQTELAKGSPFSAFTDEVSKFSLERYKVVRNNLLNEADLAMDESMYELARKLEKSGDYNNILDGDAPKWKSGAEAIKAELLGKIGKDEYSQKQFELRFGQNELKHRFQLRSEVDRQLKIASQGDYSQKLLQGEAELSDWRLDEKGRNAILRPINIFTGGYINQTKANPGKVKATIKAMELNAARAALTRYISEQPGREITTLTAMREAIRQGREGGTLEGPPGKKSLPAPLLGAENLYKRLIAFDDDELASIISTSSGDIATIYGPGFEERARKSKLTATSKILKDSANTLISQMEIDGAADTQKISDLLQGFEKLINEDPNVGSDVKDKFNELRLTSKLAFDTRKASPTDMNTIISDFKKGEVLGGSGMDTEAEQNTLNFLESRRTKMESALKDDALQWGIDNGVVEQPVTDLFNEDGSFDPMAVTERQMNAEAVRNHYNLPTVQYLTKNEVAAFNGFMKQKDLDPQVRLNYLSDFVQGWGDEAANVFLQMELENAVMQSALGSYVNNGNIETARQILIGMDKVSAGEKIPADNPKDLKTIFAELITGSDNNDILQFMRAEDKQAIFKLATAHYLGRGLTTYDEDEFVDSIQAAMGANGDKGGIRLVNNEPVLLPQDYNVEMAENVLSNLANFHLRYMTITSGGDPAGNTIDRGLILDINKNPDYVLKYYGGTEYFIYDNARKKAVSYPRTDQPGSRPDYLEKVVIDLNLLKTNFPAIVSERDDPNEDNDAPDFSGMMK